MTRPITSLPGIGEKRRALYAKLGIETVQDLLRHFPRAYQDRSQIKPLCDVKDGEIAPVIVTVATDARVTPPLHGRLQLVKFRVFDDTASATVTFFGQTYLKDVFKTGMTFRLWGKCEVRMRAISITSPQFEPVTPTLPLPDFIPVYPSTEGLSQKMISSALSLALSSLPSALPDPIPEKLREEHDLLPLSDAFRLIHRPDTEADIEKAKRRFVFESLYLFSLGIATLKESRKLVCGIPLPKTDLSPFLSALPFDLTADQQRCIADITSDMTEKGSRPMARLVSGDVGSGKTVVAAAAVYLCAKGGRQAMLMAPTEILANQHYQDLSPLLSSLGIKTALLTGSTKAAEKRRIRAELASGTLDFVIGTHALLSEGVSPARIGLVVTDEQHRFGVHQRASLADEEGTAPHVLVMSATPIPRTLALILFGDLDASTIETLPPGRQKVDTFVVDEGYRARLNAFIRKQVDGGGQVYVVCPAIEPREEEAEFAAGSFLTLGGEREEETEGDDLHYALLHTETLRAWLPGIEVSCLHGKMRPAEKESVMADFVSGKTKVLVATTVIEVGVNVPRATLMLVENAERFGLSQLHQLRGRVGRGKMKSYCILVSNTKGETAKKRLDILRQCAGGYQIAQEDLKLRGPGDFFPSEDGSARQSGEFALSAAALCSDMNDLSVATEAANETIRLDPELKHPENAPAREMVKHILGGSYRSMS